MLDVDIQSLSLSAAEAGVVLCVGAGVVFGAGRSMEVRSEGKRIGTWGNFC